MAKINTRTNISASRQKTMAPATQSFPVTPNDDADIETPGATIFVGSGGELHCLLIGDDDSSNPRIFIVPDGYDTPFCVRRVFESSTCDDMIQIW